MAVECLERRGEGLLSVHCGLSPGDGMVWLDLFMGRRKAGAKMKLVLVSPTVRLCSLLKVDIRVTRPAKGLAIISWSDVFVAVLLALLEMSAHHPEGDEKGPHRLYDCCCLPSSAVGRWALEN